MNESGKTVNNVCTYFDIKSDEIIVIHDELDLVPGAAKIQFGGGAAGHNGSFGHLQILSKSKVQEDTYRYWASKSSRPSSVRFEFCATET